MTYSSREIVAVTRYISRIILKHPELLNELGVFRESGNKLIVDGLIQKILSSKTNPDDEQVHTIHEYIGAIKHVLLNRTDKVSNTTFNQFIHHTLGNKQHAKIDNLFIALIKTGTMDNIYLAEAFYGYFRLAAISVKYQSNNKMDAHNLGMILGACLSIDELMADSQDLSQFSKKFLQSNQIPVGLSFIHFIARKHPEQYKEIINAVERELDQTNCALKKINVYISSSKATETQKQKIIDNCKLQLKAVERGLAKDKEKLNANLMKKSTKNSLKQSIEEQEAHSRELISKIKLTIADESIVHNAKQECIHLAKQHQNKIKSIKGYLSYLNKIEDNWSCDFSVKASEYLDRFRKKGTIGENRFFTRSENHQSEWDRLLETANASKEIQQPNTLIA